MSVKKDSLIEKINEYLEIHGCALSNQILKSFMIEDAWNVSNCIQELLQKNQLEKKLYRGSDFYYLPGNEAEVKRKIRVVKKYIIECVKKFGPLKARALCKKIQDNYDYDISNIIVYRLAKELKDDDEVDAVKDGPNNIYFEKGNKKQINEANHIVQKLVSKKRLIKMKELCEDYCLRLDVDFSLTSVEKKILDNLYEEIEPFLSINVSGRKYENLISTLYFFFIKKKIFDLLSKNPTFGQISPWLNLHEKLLERKNSVFTRLHAKTFNFFAKEISGKLNFEDKKVFAKILRTPGFNLRIKYLLYSYFDFESYINESILNFIKEAIKKGFNISGKDFKGILGGAIYLVTKQSLLGMSQEIIAKSLKTTEVTLRSRAKELRHHL